VLDRNLPELHGDDVSRAVSGELPHMRVLMLTAYGETVDVVDGLAAGADDYLAKPFAFSELVARVRALGRRATPARPPVLEHGDVALDPGRHEVIRAGRPVELTPREFEVLRVLLAHRGRLVTRGRLLRAVWGEAYSGEDHYVHVYVSQVRRKLAAAAEADGGLGDLIVTEPGVGYRVRGD